MWPMATVEGQDEPLFTYESASSEAECIKQFEIWETAYGHRIKEAWVDSDGGRVYYKKRWIKEGFSD